MFARVGKEKRETSASDVGLFFWGSTVRTAVLSTKYLSAGGIRRVLTGFATPPCLVSKVGCCSGPEEPGKQVKGSSESWEQKSGEFLLAEDVRSGRRRTGLVSSPVYYSELIAYADDINLLTAVEEDVARPAQYPEK